jgi:transcriptional regulator with XRE-family HTH domain
MLISTLLDVAKMRSGKTYGQFADELGVDRTRLSEWKSGKGRPSASEVAYFALEAGLDVLDTISAIEEEKKPTCARIWRRVGVVGGNGGIRTLDEALHPILP